MQNPCPYCGDHMANARRKQCGKPECKRAFNAERMREWQRKYKEQNGQWYHRNYADGQRAYAKTRLHWRKRYPAHAALVDARRRALLDAAVKGDPFTPQSVYERDDWQCGVCQQPVDRDARWPDPMSPSVDHVVPLSKGGAHTLDNVQCAHLGCNSRKGARAASLPALVAPE